MRGLRETAILLLVLGVGLSWNVSEAGGQNYYGEEDPNKKVLKQGLVGAGVGAISAEASGGKAGTGALVGAGTNVIGSALVDTLSAPAPPPRQQGYYAQPAPPPQGQPYPQQPYGYQGEPQPYQQYAPPQQNQSNKILKQGLLGAGVGAISAEASGGKAGKGALIGAGTNIIGGALFDALSTPSQPQQAYYPPPQNYSQSAQPKKKIIRKYDANGNVVSEEEVWQ